MNLNIHLAKISETESMSKEVGDMTYHSLYNTRTVDKRRLRAHAYLLLILINRKVHMHQRGYDKT